MGRRGAGAGLAAIAAAWLAGCATTGAGRGGTAGSAPAVVQAGVPVLRERARDVAPAVLGTPGFQALVARMVDAMRRAPGVGLAAPQLGVPLRVLVLEDTEERMASLTPRERLERDRRPVPLRVLVNPVLVPVGDDRATFFEGCLSVPGWTALVERWAEVEVRALDERGGPVTWRVRGWPARILQHEVDHLDGTLYVDRMLPRTFGTASEVKARWGGRPIDEVLRAFGRSATPPAP